MRRRVEWRPKSHFCVSTVTELQVVFSKVSNFWKFKKFLVCKQYHSVFRTHSIFFLQWHFLFIFFYKSQCEKCQISGRKIAEFVIPHPVRASHDATITVARSHVMLFLPNATTAANLVCSQRCVTLNIMPSHPSGWSKTAVDAQTGSHRPKYDR